MGDEAFETDGVDEPSQSWRRAITWTGLLTAGYVLYEVTNQPAVGTAAVCLKFGWQDFRTARWLWQTDPCRPRGRACWWLYVGWGLMKVGLVALGTNAAVVIGMAFIVGRPGVQFGGPWLDRLLWSLAGGALTALAALLLSAVATIRAVRLAVRHQGTLWLNSSVDSARRRRAWPPTTCGLSGTNFLGKLQISAVVSTSVGTYFGVSLLTFLVISFVFVVKSFIVAVLLTFSFPLLMASVAGRALYLSCVPPVLHSVHADSPAECWRPDEPTALRDDPGDMMSEPRYSA
jgi:hypothetical protein